VTDEQRPYGSGQADPALKRVRTRHFQRAKEQGIKITGLTSYDFLSASIFDDAGIDFLLVGDSAGNTVFGYDTTHPGHRRRADPAHRGGRPRGEPGVRHRRHAVRLLRERPRRGARDGDPVHEGDRRPTR
jgi:hypothetical protein